MSAEHLAQQLIIAGGKLEELERSSLDNDFVFAMRIAAIAEGKGKILELIEESKRISE